MIIQNSKMFQTTALDLLKKEISFPSIRTSNQELDNALGSGIKLGIITEICGKSGSGKTQMCLQLCVNVQIPKELGGLNGKSIYIDTRNGFTATRYQEISQGCLNRIQQKLNQNLGNEFQQVIKNFTLEHLMNSLNYCYISNYIELMAAVHLTKNLVKKDENIKLIIIDSISFLLKNGQEISERTRILFQILTELQIIADTNNLAIVTTNEMTTCGTENSDLKPSLGKGHHHKVTERIIFDAHREEKGVFLATIDKSLNRPISTVYFRVNGEGVLKYVK